MALTYFVDNFKWFFPLALQEWGCYKMSEGNALEKRPPRKSHLDSSKVGENAIGDFISHFMPVVKVLFGEIQGAATVALPADRCNSQGADTLDL